MSAQVTEAHRELACTLTGRHYSISEAAELIADSEARVVAAAVVTLEARITSDEELFHDIRMKLTAACGDPYKLHDEALDAIIAERDQLRAEVERLKKQIKDDNRSYGCELRDPYGTIWEQATKDHDRAGKAERALAELREWQAGVIANERLHHAELKEALARAEKVESELANIRALANRRNKRDHSQDTTHQLVAALDQALDIAQAELAACKESLHLANGTANLALVHRDAAEAELATERARLDWLDSLSPGDAWGIYRSSAQQNANLHAGDPRTLRKLPGIRAAIDAAMKEDAK